jgi:hypothetical protein
VVAGLDDLRAQLESVVIPSAALHALSRGIHGISGERLALRSRRQGLVALLGMTAVAILASLTLACDGGPSVRAAQASSADSAELARRTDMELIRQDSLVRAHPGYIVDSILPVEEEIRRFQATLGDRPSGFANGATSRSGLVAAFARALEHNDTTALMRLVINRAEFGYLVYPTSPNAAAPYRQSPDLVWLMRSAANEKAASRLMSRFGGHPPHLASYACRPAERQGDNRLWTGCTVRWITARGNANDLRMFGSIIERNGRFKLLSLTNGL